MTETVKPSDDPRVVKHQMLLALESKKKKYMTAFFLCLLLGFWGAHRYYLGHKTKAMAMTAIWGTLIAITLFLGYRHDLYVLNLILGSGFAAFAESLYLGLVWGFADLYAVLDEFVLFTSNKVKNPEILNLYPPRELIPDILRVCYGMFVVWEIFNIVKLTDRENADIRAEHEKGYKL